MALTEQQFAEHLIWALCESSGGAGPDKCDPEHCVCGADARAVAKIIYRNGYVIKAADVGDRTEPTTTAAEA